MYFSHPNNLHFIPSISLSLDYLLEEYHNQEEKTFATFFIFLLEKSILFKNHFPEKRIGLEHYSFIEYVVPIFGILRQNL